MNDLKQLSINYYNEAIEHISLNNITKAKFCLEEACSINSESKDFYNLLGLCNLKLCNFTQAKDIWEKSLLLVNSENEAKKYLEYINNDIADIIQRFNKCLQLILNEEFSTAFTELKRLADGSVELVDVYVLLSLLYLKNNELANALKMIKVALTIDGGNEKSIELYRIINEKHINSTRRSINFKRDVFLPFSVLVVSTCIVAGYMTIKSNNEISSLEDKYNSTYTALQDKDKQLDEVNKELDEVNESLNNLITNNYKESFNEYDLLNSGISNYKNNNYLDSIKDFNLLKNEGIDTGLKSEAIFWLAKSYEILGNYDMAKNEYDEYINNFNDGCYFDDSLYNISIMLFKNENNEESKKYAEILVDKCSNSMFNNNNIKRILSQ